MGKNQLKTQNKDLTFSLVDFLSILDPSKTNKYTEFLIKEFKKAIIQREELNKNNLIPEPSEELHDIYQKIRNKTEFERYILTFIFKTLQKENIETLWSFHEHCENNRVKLKDIQKYNSFNDISNAVSIVDIELLEKELKNEIHELYRDNEWLVLKPLSFQASLAYGATTKWCTSMKNDIHYFYDYSNRGNLIYIINRKNNYKVALFIDYTKNYGGLAHVVSFWDALDNKIDSIEVNLPDNIMKILKLEINGPKVLNSSLFSTEEWIRGYDNEKTGKLCSDPTITPTEQTNEVCIEDEIPVIGNDDNLIR